MPPPHRWDHYSTIGEKIKDTRFIPFKVPLKPGLCKGLPENERFTPQHLLDHIHNRGYELKLIIDLTNTAKYYSPQEFIKCGIKYRKFYTVGHAIPNATVVRTFTNAVDEFLAKNTNSEHLIGVHCTHGVNRTGYLICRYMIDKLSFTPEDAIDAFAQARGHSIERDNYIRDLKGSDSANEDDVGTDDGDASQDYSNHQYYSDFDYSNSEQYSGWYSNSEQYGGRDSSRRYSHGYHDQYQTSRHRHYYNYDYHYNSYYDNRYSNDQYSNGRYGNGSAYSNMHDSGQYHRNKWNRGPPSEYDVESSSNSYYGSHDWSRQPKYNQHKRHRPY